MHYVYTVSIKTTGQFNIIFAHQALGIFPGDALPACTGRTFSYSVQGLVSWLRWYALDHGHFLFFSPHFPSTITLAHVNLCLIGPQYFVPELLGLF